MVGVIVHNIDGAEVIRTRFKEWFLIDMQLLEQRILDGLPMADRDNQDYIDQIESIVFQAKEEKKVHRLVAGTGGVIPGAVNYWLEDEDVYFCSEDTAPLLFSTATDVDSEPLEFCK